MLDERQMEVRRQICRNLKDCGEYLLPEVTLRGFVRRGLTPPATTSEIDEGLADLDGKRRILAEDTETGRKWTLTDEGRAWYRQNA